MIGFQQAHVILRLLFKDFPVYNFFIMVREIDGGGNFYRDVAQSLGIDDDVHSKIFFRIDSPDAYEREDIVRQQLSTMPDFDERSFMIANSLDGQRHEVRVLYVPKPCPRLMPERFEATDELPPADESYIVNARSTYPIRKKTVILLVKNPDEAFRIAMRIVQPKWGCNRRQILVEVVNVSPEEWQSKGEELIDQGHDLPDGISRWAGLRAYAEKRRRERPPVFPSTILR